MQKVQHKTTEASSNVLGVERNFDILSGAIASIPSCPGEAKLAEMVRLQAERLTPVVEPVQAKA